MCVHGWVCTVLTSCSSNGVRVDIRCYVRRPMKIFGQVCRNHARPASDLHNNSRSCGFQIGHFFFERIHKEIRVFRRLIHILKIITHQRHDWVILGHRLLFPGTLCHAFTASLATTGVPIDDSRHALFADGASSGCRQQPNCRQRGARHARSAQCAEQYREGINNRCSFDDPVYTGVYGPDPRTASTVRPNFATRELPLGRAVMARRKQEERGCCDEDNEHCSTLRMCACSVFVV